MTKHQAIERINQHLGRMSAKEVKHLLDALEDTETSEAETKAILRDHPDILERIQRLESGETKTIPWEDVKAELGL